MNRPALPHTFTGGCHCGAVRFRVTVRTWRASDCNCSLCTMKHYLHVIVPKDDFTLEKGADRISTYKFNTGVAKHHFCRTCGVHSFYVPRSHPDGFSVNARCLDETPLDWFDVEPWDGRNWEAHAARHLK
ncbi:MAG TPA: GFA family protein [Polyangiaceae bacterium]|nr:GFA family protein [Polyangiaceae bacterium]